MRLASAEDDLIRAREILLVLWQGKVGSGLAKVYRVEGPHVSEGLGAWRGLAPLEKGQNFRAAGV